MNSRVMPADLRPFSRAKHRHHPEDADSVDLRGLVRTIWRYRWILAACAIGMAVITWLAVGMITPTYSALAKVMLDPRKAQIITNDEVVQDLDLSEQVVNGEAAVLRSNVLIEQVITSMGIDRFAEMAPEAFASVNDAAASGNADSIARAEANRMQELVWRIRKDLSVYREGESYVIGVRVENGDPVMAADIANGVVNTYIGGQITGRRDTARRATNWLEARVAELRGEVETAETAVATYRAKSLVADGSTLDTATQQLANLAGQLIEARADRATSQARYEQLRSVQETGGDVAVAKIVTSPLIEQLTTERIELVRQDDNWAERYDEDHVERVRLKAKMARLDGDVESEVQRIIDVSRNELEIAQIRETTLQEGISTLEERIQSISQNSLGVRQLEREAAAARGNYESLLSRLTETRTQEQLQEPDAKLIEKATIPGAPSAPRPKLMGALGGMLGGALGLGVIFFFEMTAQTFRSTRELESETGLAMLAAIPNHGQSKKGLMAATRWLAENPYSLYGERIRHLRTSLLMRDGKDQSRAIMLLSNAPGEGKTTTTLALAQMSAMAGKSVIVVDCDLRRSTMQKSFGWDIDLDLADFIRGNCALSDAVYSDPDFGFDFLAATGSHPDVADRLSVPILAPMIEDLKRVYDVVLVDAPALLAVSDALVLAQVVDTRVLLVRWNSTPRRAVSSGLAALDEMRLDVTGTAMTMVDPSKSSDDPNIEGYAYDA